jgi:spore coat polysaccharide biosynthesis protein SpsF
MTKVVAIIQARMGSTRLPGKVMTEIVGKPMLWHLVDRVKKCRSVDLVVVATTTNKEDRVVKELAEKSGAKAYCGSEDDVLDRYYQAAKLYGADVVVRITADCPLIDPHLVDRMVKYFEDNRDKLDYVGMGSPNPYPDGLDAEVFSFKVLKKAWKETKLKSEREHVTPYIWKNEKLFRIGAVALDKDLSRFRWTVDEEKDLRFVREVYKHLYKEGQIFATEEILELLSRKPELLDINQGIQRNEGYAKSLKEDSFVKDGSD